jgi:hemerythrin superfamily protein
MDLQSAIGDSESSASESATDLLRGDHEHVNQLFEQYRLALEEDADGRDSLAREICMQLDIHARIEEEVFYPAVSQIDAERIAMAYDEHADIKECIAIIEELTIAEPEYDATVLRMMQLVEQHVAEEEGELFPLVEEQMPETLLDLAIEMQQLKEELVGSADDLESRS